MSITSLLRPWFVQYWRKELELDSIQELVQRRVLNALISRGRLTEWGRMHGYDSVHTYNQYANAVEPQGYENIRPLVMRMIEGEPNLLWPGTTRRFAQSSGTSDGKSKYIPVTADSLRLNHYAGTRHVVASYLSEHADSRLFDGRALILGGSFANELEGLKKGVCVGDLSANLIDAMNPFAELVRVPDRRTALMPDWSKKLPLLASKAARANVTNLSGVPSWFYTVLRRVLAERGATEIHEVWPHLEVFFHGGIAMSPYRALYDGIIDPARMNYVETYNASEGFFALQDNPASHALRLLTNCGVFYEFQPLDGSAPLPCWQVKQGETYSLIITAPNGLWRYPIGDTVTIESTAPLRITIAGRTKSFINAFGEEVMVHNTDAALAHACSETGALVLNYTVAPVFTTSRERGSHQWLIEFEQEPRCGIEQFAAILDSALQAENSDYQAKRQADIFLAPLTVTVARPGLFDLWLAQTGRLGGQRKVARLRNDRQQIDSMLSLNFQ